MKLTLRAHHLLCLKGFQGYGYDDDFVKNMTEVSIQRKRPGTTVEIVDCPDDICRACPNLKDGICENPIQNENIIRMDMEVLKHFDTSRQYDSIDLFDEIDDIFSTRESLSKICFECKWHEKCLFYQKISKYR